MEGLIGKKVGMTQVYDADGRRVCVTVIEVGPCPVVQVKTLEQSLQFPDMILMQGVYGRYPPCRFLPAAEQRLGRSLLLVQTEDAPVQDSLEGLAASH